MFQFLSKPHTLHKDLINYTKNSLKYAVIALALLLAACGDENSATPTPTPTPTQSIVAQPAVAGTQGDSQEAAATITSLITATLAAPVASQPAPSPTATEIQQPADLLQRGERWLRYGDFAAARKDFQTVIDNPASNPDLQLQATFDLARAYRADGMFEQALASLEMFSSPKIENSTLASQLAPKVWLLRGELQQSIGDPSTTIESMRQVLALYPWAEELIQSEIASAQAQVGNVDETVKAYRAAASKATTDVARASWLEQSARANSSGSRHSDAIADLDAILSFAKQPDYRADLQYRVGQLYATAGNEASAIERWFLATKEAADSQSAYLALVELINREVPFDPYLRAKIDLQAEAWFPAINAYQIFLESVPISDTRHAIALHELGLSQLGAEDVDAAIATFDRVIAQFPQCTCLGQTWMDKARAQVIRGDSSGARRSYRTFAREHPTDSLAPEALWQSGIRALRDDNRIEAAADFLALSDAFPESERTPFALYVVATGAFQGGFYTQAANLYMRLQEDYPDQLPEAVSYWLGRSWDAHGEKDEAKRVL